MKFAKTALAGALALGLVASAAATPVDTLFNTRNSQNFLLTDTSGEILVKNPANTGGATLETGDFLVGALNFESFSNPGTPVGSAGVELTAFFATTVTGISSVATSIADFTFGSPGAAFWSSQFGPGILLTFAALGVDPDKVAGLLFEDGPNQFDRGDGIAASFGEATDGMLRAIIGFDGVDDYWFARGPKSIATFAGPGSTTNALGHLNFGLSFLYENIAGDFLDQTANFTQDELDTAYTGSTLITPFSADAQLVGDGGLFRPGAANPGVTDPFPVYDKVDIALSHIPEPGTMALAGLALVGLGFSRRRQANVGV